MPSFPSTGFLGLVRPLHWYFEDTPTSAARLAGSLRSPSDTRVASGPSLPPVADAFPEGLGLSGSATPVPIRGSAGDGRPPRFLGNPNDSSPGSTTPVGPTRQALRRADAAPAFANREGSRRAERFRGSISRLSVWLSTLRGVGRPTPRKTRFRLLASSTGRDSDPQGSSRKFPSCSRYISFPFSRLRLAQWQNFRE